MPNVPCVYAPRPCTPRPTSRAVATIIVTLGLAAGWLPTAPAAPDEPVRQSAVPRKPGEHGVGRHVASVDYTDLSGAPQTVGDGDGFTIFAATSTSCPLSMRYVPSLAALASQLPQTFRLVLVNPTASDQRDAMLRDTERIAKNATTSVAYVHDADGSLAQALGLQTTTDVVIIDPARTIRYHGAIDDQYGFGYALDAPKQNYLRDAVAAIADSREPVITATNAPGCELETRPMSIIPSDLTYHREIARLVQRHCVECHRDGGVGPFALDTYDDLTAHAGMVRDVVRRGTMPPWFAADTSQFSTDDTASGATHTPAHLTWTNDRSLAASEKEMLLAWLDGSRPIGDPNDAPRPRTFPDGWQIGKPDKIWEFAQPQEVKATGVMPYQNVVVETGLREDRWVRAIEVRPGAPEVVHHVLVHVLHPAQDDVPQEDREGYWAVYVPGQSVHTFPEGFAKKIPAGARLNFQMHYTPNGTATTDSTRLGVVFCDEPEHEVRTAGIVNTRLQIPPGASNHREDASITIPTEAVVLGFFPHMHLRGKACRYELTRGEQTTTLLDVPRYDFNWQLSYRFAEPLLLTAGDRLHFTAWFDNSKENPANPDPTQTVRWGPQTFEEMHLGYLEYYLPQGAPGEAAGGEGPWGRFVAQLRQTDLKAAFDRLDANHDGQLTPDELPERLRERLMRLDLDQSGDLSREEAALLRR
ncbi:MAG: redoxin [Pirellulales bacterium]